ncbi:hypothetical protein [Pseudorhodoferax sp. Leaf267]|uniref:hypothetical protein n=1 Tax=Pseudorhodoferax sp. Leaf267 TaxID=1736316 RepID=UPI0006F8CE4B|nr:hypothetical protein [Pseudorhodoferax sp. Leaf267]KQP23015.1 hypothetical protein ASF43_03765 [Pseudorhodoferax sp. Leaf267]
MNKVLAAALLAASCTLAHAESSAAKKELVAKILQQQRPVIEAQARALGERPAAAMMQQAAVVIQQRVPVDKREAVIKDIQGDLRQYVDEATAVLREQALKLHPTVTGAVLDAKFSESELKQLVDLLESPVFRKYQQSTDEMLRPLNERLVQDSRGVIEPKLKVLDQAIRKRLEAAIGAPAPAAKP